MGESTCQFRSSLKEIEYFSEDKVTFYFSKLFCVHICFQFLICIV
jgi:hypothetical protein